MPYLSYSDTRTHFKILAHILERLLDYLDPAHAEEVKPRNPADVATQQAPAELAMRVLANKSAPSRVGGRRPAHLHEREQHLMLILLGGVVQRLPQCYEVAHALLTGEDTLDAIVFRSRNTLLRRAGAPAAIEYTENADRPLVLVLLLVLVLVVILI